MEINTGDRSSSIWAYCLGRESEEPLCQGTRRSEISSACSSSASFASTAALIGKKHTYLGRAKMDEGVRREMNILISNTSLEPAAITQDKKFVIDEPAPKPTVTKQALIPQGFAAVAVSLASLVVGFASAYTSPALVSMNEPGSTLPVSTQEESWIGSLLPLFALIGGVVGGPMIEVIGRRNTILFSSAPFMLSFLFISLANSVALVMVGRAIAGFGVGVTSLALPIYLGETLQPEVRGALGLIPTVLGNGGILVCFIAGKYLDWSELAMLGACLPIAFLSLMFFIPETPRFYINKKHHKRAQKSLAWLRGSTTDISKELNDIEKTIESSKGEKTKFSELFTKKYLWPLGLSIGLMFFQQLSGINAVIFYTVKIFQDAGSTIDSNLSAIIVGLVNVGSTFVASVLIERLGRKILLYISSISMVITLIALGTFFYLKDAGNDVSCFGWLPLASFVIFVIGFSIGFGPIPWLMMGELLPARIRGCAASVVTAFNWACTFLVTKTFSDLVVALGSHGTFWVFGGFCFIGLIFVAALVPETQGKSLEEIEHYFSSRCPSTGVSRTNSVDKLKPDSNAA